MKPHSRLVVFAGINFLTIPAPVITYQYSLAFQQAIVANGLEFIRVENPKNSLVVSRDIPYPLQITVSMLEPQAIGQIMVLAPQPKGGLELIIKEAEAAILAFENVWPADKRQIIKADATIRELYETTSEHAFQELWEKRLGQNPKALESFGRPIRGGGLRFVLDPIPGDLPVQIDIKVESFLMDTTKIFVETQFNWPIPTNPGTPFNVRERLSQMNSYIEKEINSFLTGEVK
jgi:hypothetical protein